MTTERIDVLVAMDQAANAIEKQWAIYEGAGSLLKARAAVAELIEAAKEASATLGHAYHTVLVGSLSEDAHTAYQRLDAALENAGGAE